MLRHPTVLGLRRYQLDDGLSFAGSRIRSRAEHGFGIEF
jgi:hypothetical protein